MIKNKKIIGNTRAIVRIQGHRENRNGVEYVAFNQLDVKMKIDKAKFDLANLFNGDPVLGHLGNEFIKQNVELFVNELTPGMEKSLAKTFLGIVNVVMKNVTYDEMFPNT